MWLLGQPLVANSPKTPVEHDLIIIGGNAVMSVGCPITPKNEVLGTLDRKVDIDDLRNFTRENNPEIYKVIMCESGWNNYRIGQAGEIGLGQFLLSTWQKFNLMRGTNLDIRNPFDQVDLMIWAWKNNLQNHWTCYFKNY